MTEQGHPGGGIRLFEIRSGRQRQGFNKLRVPKIFNLRADPFERGDSSFLYDNWMVHRVHISYGAQTWLRNGFKAFKEFPIRQKPASFDLDEVMRKLTPAQ